ncbi:proline racemase family protein [Mesorhizobium sp. M1403]|uniref:proline racemase family protein n=1 Tax=Mesorhizobium sp. M1403 TaxID=2957097 RepID=UPI00333626F8
MKFSHRLSIVDSHTAGEPSRFVVSGFPRIPGSTMAERMRNLINDFDWIRRVTMNEPRGHRDMFGGVIVPPVNSTSHVGVVYMDGGQFYNMCGHASLGLCGMLVETGQVPRTGRTTEVRIDTPAGLVVGSVKTNDEGDVEAVSLIDVASFAFALDQYVDVPQYGRVRVDFGYGGNIFVIAEAADLGFQSIDPQHTTDLIKAGVALRTAAREQFRFQHPEHPHINGIDLAMLTAPASSSVTDARNIVILGRAQADRSPCGTGTCARMAVEHAKGRLGVDERFRHESSIRTYFDARILETTKVGSLAAVIPEISCRPFLTGFSEFIVDPDDPLGNGFILG